MPGTHEELFDLIHLITDPDAAKAMLAKQDAVRKDVIEQRNQSIQAREEAASNNAAAQRALADAKALAVKASADRVAAQDRKDKADIALSEGNGVTEKNKMRTTALDQRETTLTAFEKELRRREEALALREQKVDELNKELNRKMDQLKQLTA